MNKNISLQELKIYKRMKTGTIFLHKTKIIDKTKGFQTMKLAFIFLMMFLLPGVALAEQLHNKPADYCYKPGKPLLFSKNSLKQRYEEDMREYRKCVKDYHEMLENIAEMREQAMKNADSIYKKFSQRKLTVSN
jgi:hypothetical protein